MTKTINVNMRICLVLIFVCLGKAYSQVDSIWKAEIFSVGKGILANHRISCNKFDSVFSKSKQSYLIKDIDTLANLSRILKKSKFKKKDLKVDVRCKMRVYYSDGRVITICIDDFGNILLDEKYLKRKEELFSFITAYRK